MNFNLNLSSTNFIIINILAAAIGIYFILKNKNNKNKKTNRENNEVELNFYEKSYFYKGANLQHNTIIAMLLSLSSRGVIDIKKTFYKNKKGEDIINYIFTKEDLTGIDRAERILLEILFSFNDKNEISSRELNRLRRVAPDDYNHKFYEFTEYMENHFKDIGLKQENNSHKKVLTNFLGFFILLGIAMISLYNRAYIGLINMALSVMFFGISIQNVAELPESGKNKFKELMEVENKLKKLDIDTKNPTLVAIGFGLKYENIIAIRNKNKDDYAIYFDNGRSDFQKTMRTALVGDSFLVK